MLAIDRVRKFAHHGWDYTYMHAGLLARWGAKGLDVETAIKRYKTDRSMLDIEFTFVSA